MSAASTGSFYNFLRDHVKPRVDDDLMYANQYYYDIKAAGGGEIWENWYNLTKPDGITYPITTRKITRFHTKIAWFRGKDGTSNSFVLMGSINAKNTDSTDMDFLIKSDNNSETDIFYDYYLFKEYLKQIEY